MKLSAILAIISVLIGAVTWITNLYANKAYDDVYDSFSTNRQEHTADMRMRAEKSLNDRIEFIFRLEDANPSAKTHEEIRTEIQNILQTSKEDKAIVFTTNEEITDWYKLSLIHFVSNMLLSISIFFLGFYFYITGR